MEEKTKIKYAGSANGIPRLGLKFKDGDVLTVPKATAERLVEQNIGFKYVKERSEKRKVKPDAE